MTGVELFFSIIFIKGYAARKNKKNLLRQALFFQLALAEALPETLPSLVTTGMRIVGSAFVRPPGPPFQLVRPLLQILFLLFFAATEDTTQHLAPKLFIELLFCCGPQTRLPFEVPTLLPSFDEHVVPVLRPSSLHSSQVEFSNCDRVAKMRVDDHGCAPRKPLPDPRKPSPGWTRLLVTGGRVVVARLSFTEREPTVVAS